jgi:tRNA G18 (ribose-2'-O)-methylase SpoU
VPVEVSPARLVRIERADDPRVALYAAVRDPELARTHQRFVAEGRLVVRRLIEDARYRVDSVLVTETARQALASSLSQLPAQVPVYVCAAGVMNDIAGFHIHRGCLALAQRPEAPDLDLLLRESSLLVVLEDVSDADNVGAVFRNAAAFGVDAVLLSPGTCDPLYRKAIRTSMAASLRIPFTRLDDWPAQLVTVQRAGFSLVALTPATPSETLAEFCASPRPGRLALLVGSEGPGLTAGALAAATRRVRIPINERIDSLNLAAATAVVLSRLSE